MDVVRNRRERLLTGLLGLAAALLWLWYKRPAYYLYCILAQQPDGGMTGPVAACLATYVAAFALAAVGVGRSVGRSAHRPAAWGAALASVTILGILGSLYLMHAVAQDLFDPPLLAASTAAATLYVVFFFTLWTTLVARMPKNRMLVLLALSLAFGELLRSLIKFLNVDFVYVALPFAIAGLLACAASRPSQRPANRELEPGAPVPWALIVTCMVLLVVWSLIMRVAFVPVDVQHTSTDRGGVDLVALIVCLAFALFFFLYDRRRGIDRRIFLYPSAFIVVAYLTCLAGVLLFLTQVPVWECMIALARCLEALSLLLVIHFLGGRRTLCAAVIGVFMFVTTSSYLLRVPGLITADVTPLIENVVIGLFFVTSIAFIVCLLMYQSAPDADADTDGRAGNRRGRLEAACAQTSREASLTPKESEVLELVFRGHSAKRIAEELSISDNTVRTHTTSIYRKLGVHSKQELIRLIDDRMEAGTCDA